MEEGDLEAREDQIRKARTMLWAALAGGLVMVFGMVTGRAGWFFTGFVLSWFGGLSGVRDVARAIGTHPLVMYPALVIGFAPVFNLLPIVYFLARSYQALEPGGAAEEPAPRPEAARPAPPRPAAAVKPKPATGIRGAVACVKGASLGGQVPDGESLTARITQPGIDMKPEDLPVMRATQGHFAVCYLIDEGSHYSFANHGQLKAAGLSLEELHRLAVGNLAALIGAKPGLALHSGAGHHGLTMGGQFEASLVLVDDLWDRTLAEHFPNGPLVAIPARDVLLFCDAKSREGLGHLRAAVARVTAGGNHLLAEKVFARVAGQWRAV